jgi:hypothetical protein
MQTLHKELRPWFHWKHANWTIGLLLGAAVSAFLADQYTATYGCVAICSVWGIISWLTSDNLDAHAPRLSSKYDFDSGQSISVKTGGHNYVAWQVIPILLIVIGASILVWRIHAKQFSFELQQLEGRLYPDNLEAPRSCLRAANELQVIMGSNIAVESQFPHSIITIGCDSLLTIDRDSDGVLTITKLDVFDSQMKIIVSIRNGKFVINKLNYFVMSRVNGTRPSRSVLSVTDQSNVEVLNLDLINKNTLIIKARLFYPAMRDHALEFGFDNDVFKRNGFSNDCMANSAISTFNIAVPGIADCKVF